MKKNTPVTYKRAGVDIDAGDALVERIKPLAEATRRKGSMDCLGGFGALFDLKKTGYKDPLLVSATDGVGTKLKIAQILGRHDTIGIDLVAMCVNDLVVQGAEPLFFLDYFATGKLSVDTAQQVIAGIARGCKLAGCALVGGETAEMPGMYPPGEYDLAGFAVGAVERKALLPRRTVKKGDVALGLASSGLHSNGFSLVRHIMALHKIDYHAPASLPGKKQSWGELLLTPTRIYVKSCLKSIRAFPEDINALAHITGGGLVENIPRVLPETFALDCTAADWKRPPIFEWLAEHGNLPPEEMHRTFNCGIGMVVIVSQKAAAAAAKTLEAAGEEVCVLGGIVSRGRRKAQVILHA